MARRAELFVRELTDKEATHLLNQARRGKTWVTLARKKTELHAWVAERDIELVFTLNGSDYQSRADQDAPIRADLRWQNRNARPSKPWRRNAEVHHSQPNVAT